MGHAKETQTWIPVLKEPFLLWERHDSTHEGIRQEWRLLMTTRWYAHCMLSAASIKSTSSAWHTMGPSNALVGEMSNEWIRGTSDSCWRGLLSSVQPTPRPLPLLSTSRWNAVGTKITVMSGTPKGALTYTGMDRTNNPPRSSLQPNLGPHAGVILPGLTSPYPHPCHPPTEKECNWYSCPADVINIDQSLQLEPQALGIVQEIPCGEWECKGGTT